MNLGGLRSARRYAQALLETCPESEQDELSRQLQTLRTLWLELPAFKALLQLQALSLTHPDPGQGDWTRHFHPLALQCLLLLRLHRRLPLLSDLGTEFDELLALRRGQLNAVLVAAQPMADRDVAAWRLVLEQHFKQQVPLQCRWDSNVQGGVKIETKRGILDWTVQKQFQCLQRHLSRN